MNNEDMPPVFDDCPGAALDRLEASFGKDALNSLLADLADTLTQALVALDSGRMDTKVAHQIAGSSGTLGFAAVSRAWLALSQDIPDAASEARYETRRALATLAAR